MAYLSAQSSLEQQAFDQLVAMQAIKKGRIESYFERYLDDVQVLSANPTIVAAATVFNQAFMESMVDTQSDEPFFNDPAENSKSSYS